MVRVRRTVGMADPGNGGPESLSLSSYHVYHILTIHKYSINQSGLFVETTGLILTPCNAHVTLK